MAKPIFDDEWWSCSGIGSKTGPHFTDRARPGSKLHLVTEAQGIPLALILIGASRNGVAQPLPLIEAIAPIRGKRDGRCPSRSSCRPIVATITTNSKPLHAAGIAAQSARRGEPHGSGLSIRPGGASSAASHGCTTSGDCPSGSNASRPSMRRSWKSPLASFAGDSSEKPLC